MNISESTKTLERNPRTFLPGDLKVESWEGIEPFCNDLLNRPINSIEDLKRWLKDRSELNAVISEDLGWRYINMTRYTENETYSQAYQFFVTEIQPKIAPFSDKLNKKAMASEYLKDLETKEGYDIMIREMRKDIEIFREENIPLFTKIQTETRKYGQISGAMTVTIDKEEMTLQQAAVLLQSTDRAKREEVYHQVASRRLEDKDTLDELYNTLISLRTEVAKNAGFDNYRDYMFKAMGRFDYGPQDCFDFHNSVQEAVVPMLDTLAAERKSQLQLDPLRPWDKAVDPHNREALKPFDGGEDLAQKTIECFERLDPFLGQCLSIMKEMGHLDLVSRKGKAPGGYNYPLSEIGVPFIFMNATSTLRDMITILHEGGHAVHSFLTRDLELTEFKHTPSEVAELASMSMELISMDHWDIFFSNEEDLLRAKKEHLEQIIETLPWVAVIDKFQHWIYENAGHRPKERISEWNKILNSFSDTLTRWDGLEENKNYLWQKQLHLYEVPFYYIEYGMAQLGAVAVWKNYKADAKKGLEGYMNALKLGYTRSIPQVYAAANIEFNFSKEYIHDLMQFVRQELDGL